MKVALEGLEETPCQRDSLAPEPRVERWLPAARLASREVDVDAKVLQHANGALADLRVELIDDARDEE